MEGECEVEIGASDGRFGAPKFVSARRICLRAPFPIGGEGNPQQGCTIGHPPPVTGIHRTEQGVTQSEGKGHGGVDGGRSGAEKLLQDLFQPCIFGGIPLLTPPHATTEGGLRHAEAGRGTAQYAAAPFQGEPEEEIGDPTFQGGTNRRRKLEHPLEKMPGNLLQGGARLVAPPNLFHRRRGDLRRGRPPGGADRLRAGDAETQLRLADLFTGTDHHRGENPVLQFPHVSGPFVGPHSPLRPGGEAPHGLVVLQRIALQEMAGEWQDIVGTFTQGGRDDGDDVEAVEEILPEPPRLHLFPQIAVGGRQDPHIHPDGS